MMRSLLLLTSLSCAKSFGIHSTGPRQRLLAAQRLSSTNLLATTDDISSSLPTMEQLKSDPFIDQVGHAAQYIPLLAKDNNDADVTEMISSQLSHSDGIRGFFVSYLTGESPSPADGETIPSPLQTALSDQKSSSDLISLTCMNVIMPTGMMTMHTDEALAKNSEMTAKRGLIVAKALLEMNQESGDEKMRKQCQAILQVAKNDTEEESDGDEKYWIDFFDKWGYGEKERVNIAKAFDDLLA